MDSQPLGYPQSVPVSSNEGQSMTHYQMWNSDRDVVYGHGYGMTGWDAPVEGVLRHGPVRPAVTQYNFSGIDVWQNWTELQFAQARSQVRDRTQVKVREIRLWNINEYPTTIPPTAYGSSQSQLMPGNYNAQDVRQW